MENLTVFDAKEQLEDLIARASRGEDVRISDPKAGTVKLLPVGTEPDLFARRVLDTMPPFVPLDKPRVAGRWKGRLSEPPPGFFDPLTEEELKDWYGEDE